MLALTCCAIDFECNPVSINNYIAWYVDYMMNFRIGCISSQGRTGWH
jgi:hypothetical protein